MRPGRWWGEEVPLEEEEVSEGLGGEEGLKTARRCRRERTSMWSSPSFMERRTGISEKRGEEEKEGFLSA